MNQTTMATELIAKALELEQAAKKLREAADVLSGTKANGTAAGLPKKRPPVKKTTRLEQLIDYVREHGPATRKEILDNCGLPRGTAGALLTKKRFELSDGKWKVLET